MASKRVWFTASNCSRWLILNTTVGIQNWLAISGTAPVQTCGHGLHPMQFARLARLLQPILRLLQIALTEEATWASRSSRGSVKSSVEKRCAWTEYTLMHITIPIGGGRSIVKRCQTVVFPICEERTSSRTTRESKISSELEVLLTDGFNSKEQ